MVHFDPRWGGPETASLEQLDSWSKNPEAGVRYYSGTATYVKPFEMEPPLLQAGRKLYLDLGSVKEIAKVRLNGRDLGVLWKPPFRLDITGAVQSGSNRLEVAITNLWPIASIGDAAVPEKERRAR